MRQRKRLIAFLLANLLLVGLTSSCGTSLPRGFDYYPAQTPVEYDAYCIDEPGARDVGQKLEERKLCIKKLGRVPSVWDKFSSGFTVFGIGFASGFITMAVIR